MRSSTLTEKMHVKAKMLAFFVHLMFVRIQMIIFFIIKLQSLLNESYYTSYIQLFIEY